MNATPTMRQAARTDETAPRDRRSTDSASHAHKRSDDTCARLHQRMDDNDKIVAELLASRFELIKLHKDTTEAVNTLAGSQKELIEQIAKLAGLREFEEDVRGMMRFMGRINGAIGMMWKPLLFCAVVGGSIWIWLIGNRPPP